VDLTTRKDDLGLQTGLNMTLKYDVLLKVEISRKNYVSLEKKENANHVNRRTLVLFSRASLGRLNRYRLNRFETDA
jgi:hypothetical protein